VDTVIVNKQAKVIRKIDFGQKRLINRDLIQSKHFKIILLSKKSKFLNS